MTLEPCPFCGGEAEWRDDPGVCDVPFGLVVAHKDHCFLNHIAFEEADIISAWNTRAPDPRITELEQPYEPGAFAGDIWYGHPEKRTLGTHQWDGLAWHELPNEVESVLILLADARIRIAALEAEVARKDEALRNIRALAAKRQNEGGPDGSLANIEGFARAALEARNV